MKKVLILALLMTLPLPALAQRVPAPAGSSSRGALDSSIVAVVNDNVITKVDLEQRIQLVLLSSGLPNRPEVRAHLLPQILRTLIDEQLQVQEARRLDLGVSKEELDEALARIAHDNNIPGNILDFLKKNGVPPEAMTTQVRNGLLWSKVVQRELRPRVEVGEDEIDAVIERIRANAGKEEYLLSEILLPVDNPAEEEQVRAVAENLVNQIRKGANFAAVARQFSQSPDAAQGGDMGWIQQGQLAPEISRALATSGPKQVSAPIRTAKGFHILGVRNVRTVSMGDPATARVNLAQAFRPYGKADRAAVLKEAEKVRAAVKDCPSLEKNLLAFPGWKPQKLGDLDPASAPAWMMEKVRTVAAGSSSEPLDTDKGAAVLFVCSRDVSGIDREAIMRSIGTEKMELQARRLLRDLRRSAYMDIRIGKSS